MVYQCKLYFKNLYVALSFRPQLFFETKTAQKPYSLGPHIDLTLEIPFGHRYLSLEINDQSENVPG